MRSMPGRPRRLGLGQFALGHAVGPVAEIFERHAAELSGKPVHHPLAGLPRGDAAHPCLLAGFEFAERGRDRAGRFLAKLMAADAIDIVHPLAPDLLRDVLGDVGAAAEILGRRNLHQREPVDRRIIMRRGRLVRRRHRRQIDLLAGLGAQSWRIHQPVAAHPDLVVHIRRQVGDHIAALVVGDDDLGEFRRQFRRLRDHPDAGFGPGRTAHHAADVVIVDGNRRLLGMGRRRNQGRQASRGKSKSSQR